VLCVVLTVVVVVVGRFKHFQYRGPLFEGPACSRGCKRNHVHVCKSNCVVHHDHEVCCVTCNAIAQPQSALNLCPSLSALQHNIIGSQQLDMRVALPYFNPNAGLSMDDVVHAPDSKAASPRSHHTPAATTASMSPPPTAAKVYPASSDTAAAPPAPDARPRQNMRRDTGRLQKVPRRSPSNACSLVDDPLRAADAL